VQEPIRRSSVECAVLDVLADHTDALFVSATKQAAAIVPGRWRRALALLIVMVRHSNSPTGSDLCSSPTIASGLPHDRKLNAALPADSSCSASADADPHERQLFCSPTCYCQLLRAM
jgi:hypothetical protein